MHLAALFPLAIHILLAALRDCEFIHGDHARRQYGVIVGSSCQSRR
jgi:hypothetical protein